MGDAVKRKPRSVRRWATVLLIALMTLGCAGRTADGLFSWRGEAIADETARAALLAVAQKNGIGAIYQEADADEAFAAFCIEAEAQGVQTFLLVGQPKWALDASGTRQCEAVERAAALGADGVVLDVEPYLLNEWDTDRAALVESWICGTVAAKRLCEQKNLLLIVCVPYYLEDRIDAAQYERLVGDGCDALAVMNYYRKNEAAHLKYEAELCERFRKTLIPIYELQPPGTHGLQAVNTYYGERDETLEQSREAIRAAYGRQALAFALHDYDALRERNEDE